MAHMQQVEAAVGEHDRLARTSPLCDAFAQDVTLNNFLLAIVHADVVAEYWSMAISNYLLETVAVPRFITTMPPAKLARRAAEAVSAPAAKAAVKVAITVSPAPVTSTTWSEPHTGTASGAASFSKATIPSRPR